MQMVLPYSGVVFLIPPRLICVCPLQVCIQCFVFRHDSNRLISIFVFFQELDFEVELAFVIGKTGKKIKVCARSW